MWRTVLLGSASEIGTQRAKPGRRKRLFSTFSCFNLKPTHTPSSVPQDYHQLLTCETSNTETQTGNPQHPERNQHINETPNTRRGISISAKPQTPQTPGEESAYQRNPKHPKHPEKIQHINETPNTPNTRRGISTSTKPQTPGEETPNTRRGISSSTKPRTSEEESGHQRNLKHPERNHLLSRGVCTNADNKRHGASDCDASQCFHHGPNKPFLVSASRARPSGLVHSFSPHAPCFVTVSYTHLTLPTRSTV